MAFEIKINKELPGRVLHDNELFKSCVIFVHLKSFYRYPVIKNYRKRWKEISKKLGVSETKLRIYIGCIKRYGWAVETKDGSLRLIGRSVHAKMLGVEKCKQYWKVSFVSTKKLEAIFIKYALVENTSRQEFIIKKKIVEQKVSILEIHDEGIKKKFRCYVKKSLNIGDEINKLRGGAYFKTTTNFDEHTTPSLFYTPLKYQNSINPFVTMSRKKIGMLAGGKSESAGVRVAKKLKRYNLMEDETRRVKVKAGASFDMFRSLNLPGNYFYWKGSIWQTLPNIIRWLPNTKPNTKIPFK